MGNGLFSYENPVMQILMYIGDLIILNFLFLICSAPIFTIGAAQAGMYTAMRVLRDKEDDSSPTAAFFRGFKSGFGKITLAWGLMVLVTLVGCYIAVMAYQYGLSGWLCVIPVVILAWFTAQIPAIHSRFDCKPMQLIRNSWFLIIGHPLRTLGTAILTWLPMGLFLFGEMFTFLSLVPVWCIIYFSLAFLFSQTFLTKPFNTMVEEFNNRQTTAEGGEAAQEPAGEISEAKEEV